MSIIREIAQATFVATSIVLDDDQNAAQVDAEFVSHLANITELLENAVRLSKDRTWSDNRAGYVGYYAFLKVEREADTFRGERVGFIKWSEIGKEIIDEFELSATP